MIKLKNMPNFSTRRKPRHPRRRESVRPVARPQLPVVVPAPAVDAAAAQQGTRVGTSRGEGHDSWVRRRRHRGLIFSWTWRLDIQLDVWEAIRVSLLFHPFLK